MPHPATAAPAMRLAAVCVLLLLGLGAAGQARGQPDAAATSTRLLLRAITGHAAPFVQLPGTPVSGYSIEVWQEVARRLGVDTAWTVLPDLSDEAQIVTIAEGGADLAISALAITAAREARVDFSLPYVESGLQILATAKTVHPLAAMLSALLSPAIRDLLAAGTIILLALAHLLWLV